MTKINWKELSQTEGYRKFKKGFSQARQHDASNGRFNRKSEDKRYLKAYYFAIGVAIKIHNQTGTPIDQILGEWEDLRDYNFMSFYSDFRLTPWSRDKYGPKPITPAGVKRVNKRSRWCSSARAHEIFMAEQKRQSKRQGRKARWSKERKEREARYRQQA